MKFYVERAQFVVAPQDSGKSTQLRSMFLDKRLGEPPRVLWRPVGLSQAASACSVN